MRPQPVKIRSKQHTVYAPAPERMIEHPSREPVQPAASDAIFMFRHFPACRWARYHTAPPPSRGLSYETHVFNFFGCH